jgi:hypothetical protein
MFGKSEQLLSVINEPTLELSKNAAVRNLSKGTNYRRRKRAGKIVNIYDASILGFVAS